MDQSAVEALLSTRIFRGLSDPSLVELAARMRWRRFPKGATLMRQGANSDAMYVIANGSVRVERTEGPASQPGALLAELGPGQVVGEMGVLDRLPRSATVTAISDVLALELGGEPLVELMVHHPEVNDALRHVVSERLRDTDALVARMFADLLRKVSIFQPISPDGLAHLAERGERRHFFPGQVLMRQGAPADCLHVVARGRVQVTREHRDIKEPVLLAELGPGEIVGEMGVLDSAPRTATVTAKEDVETMELDAVALSQAMVQFPEIATALLHVVTKRMRSTDALLDELLSSGYGPSSNGTSNGSQPAGAHAFGGSVTGGGGSREG